MKPGKPFRHAAHYEGYLLARMDPRMLHLVVQDTPLEALAPWVLWVDMLARFQISHSITRGAMELELQQRALEVCDEAR